MASALRIFFHGKRKPAFLILFLYLWIILILHSCKNDLAITPLLIAAMGLLSLFIAFLILFALQSLPDYQPKTAPRQAGRKDLIKIVSVFLVIFAFYMVCFAGQFPGGMNADISDQLAQAFGETAYNDWHPVLHTLLFMTIPLKLTGSYGFAIFLQLLYFCLAFTYLIYVLYRNGGSRFLLGGVFLYVLVNPFLITYSMYAMKDIAMMIFAIVLVAYYIQIICSKGAWLKRGRNIILFAAAVILCSYMRHNAILFTGPLVLITCLYLILYKNGKTCLPMLCAIAIFFLAVKGLYLCLDVQQPQFRKLETIGLPLSIWANVTYSNPDALPEDVLAFMYEILPQDLEDGVYSVSTGFNSIKSADLISYYRIDEIPYSTVLKKTLQCFYYAPAESLEAFAKLTDIVWETDICVTPVDMFILENDWGSESSPNETILSFVQWLSALLGSGIAGTILGSVGFELLIMILLGTLFLAKNRLAFLHLLPFFCYDFGTMLLLTGRDYRFFLFNLPLWIPIIFLMFRDDTVLSARPAR